jgi:prepilin-type N-terminal cleavage/methylation domain-containing protein
MRKITKSQLKESEGFTLIELLVVVIIIGILSSIAVIGISGARKSAYAGQCTANASQLVKALVAYKASYGLFPNEPTGGFTGDYTFLKADVDKLKTDTANANTSFLSSEVPYIGSTTASPYYLQAKFTAATSGVAALAYTTSAGGTAYPGGCGSSIG